MTQKPEISCAIYTRKSSDDELDQAFNSLDAKGVLSLGDTGLQYRNLHETPDAERPSLHRSI